MKDSSKKLLATFLKQNLKVLVFENEPSAIEQFEFAATLWLFNTAKHIENSHYKVQNLIMVEDLKPVFTFILTDALQTQALAIFHLFVENQSGVSPLRASFGSFEIAENVSELEFDYLLETIENVAIEQNLADITIKHYPSCYDEIKSDFIKAGLLKNGFKNDKVTINQHIIVENSFEANLHQSEKRRLRKCERAGFVFDEWVNPDAEIVYEFIAHNRQQLGYRITFSLAELRNWLDVFPASFQVFCVRDQDQIAALTLAVRVGERVLYNFCPANSPAYRTFSPAVMLTKGLYEHCTKNNIQILDLGVSLDSDGHHKPSLAQFKQNLGAEVSEKVVFKASYR